MGDQMTIPPDAGGVKFVMLRQQHFERAETILARVTSVPTPRRSRSRPAGDVLTHFLVSADVAKSRDFYVRVLGGEPVLEGEPTIVMLANSWVIIKVGGGPTEDKPNVVLDVPDNPDRVSAFLNIRVADIYQVYEDWSAKGAQFLTPPVDFGREIRGYICQVSVPGRHFGSGTSTTLPRGLGRRVYPVGFTSGVGERTMSFDRIVFHRMDSEQFPGL